MVCERDLPRERWIEKTNYFGVHQVLGEKINKKKRKIRT
jgi:hypothetical protein